MNLTQCPHGAFGGTGAGAPNWNCLAGPTRNLVPSRRTPTAYRSLEPSQQTGLRFVFWQQLNVCNCRQIS
jgi:hypothetical protein